MVRSTRFCARWALVSGLALMGTAGAADKPNILLLLADDQRADTIAAHGNRQIRTPNLDRLVREGFSFRRNYCFGSNSGAVCVPSRAMLMSGRTWFNIDHRLTGVKILPELVREHGYCTFATGKWHNEPPAFLRGFERGKSIFFGGMADHTKVPVQDLSPDTKLVNPHTAAKFSSEEFADAVIDFLDHYRDARPFFAYVAFTAPHDPRNPPEKYRQMYYESRPSPPRNFLPQHPFDNGMMAGLRDENLAAYPRTREVISEQLAEYDGLITHLDEQIGRILDALARSGRADQTIIVYAADNGLALGSHGLLGKQSLYEHSMLVPLIFAGPGIPKNRSSQAFTYLYAVYPTLCALVGLDPPAEVEGENLQPLWKGKVTQVRRSVFLPYDSLMRAVRTERWKLILYPPISYAQLFDLQTDPDELNNLAEDPALASRVEALTVLLEEWREQVGDTRPLRVANPKPKELDLRGSQRRPDQWQPEWIVGKYFDPQPSTSTPQKP